MPEGTVACRQSPSFSRDSAPDRWRSGPRLCLRQGTAFRACAGFFRPRDWYRRSGHGQRHPALPHARERVQFLFDRSGKLQFRRSSAPFQSLLPATQGRRPAGSKASLSLLIFFVHRLQLGWSACEPPSTKLLHLQLARQSVALQVELCDTLHNLGFVVIPASQPRIGHEMCSLRAKELGCAMRSTRCFWPALYSWRHRQTWWPKDKKMPPSGANPEISPSAISFTAPAESSTSLTACCRSLRKTTQALTQNFTSATRTVRSGRPKWGSKPSLRPQLRIFCGLLATTPMKTISSPKYPSKAFLPIYNAARI